MEELVRQIQKEWEAAKKVARDLCTSTGNWDMARNLETCNMFKGNENLEELVKLMFTPRGIEFMSRYHFPSIDTFRRFKPYHPERYGVYIDFGKISLTEVRKVFLIGNTTAELKYRDTAGNRLYLMCKAKASVIASGYSVVRVEKDDNSEVSYIKKDHARILI